MRLCTCCTAHRESRGIALPIHDHGNRREWGVSITPRLLFTPGKYPVPIVQEAGWAPGPVWTGAENLAPTGIRSPDRPARSQSLYRLSYPAHYVLYRQHILLRGERQRWINEDFNLQRLHRFSFLHTWLIPSTSSLKFRETSPSVWPTISLAASLPQSLKWLSVS